MNLSKTNKAINGGTMKKMNFRDPGREELKAIIGTFDG